MARFYLIGKISAELMKRMQNDPSADRYASTKKVTEAAGLKLISYEWVRGRFDIISCVEGDYEQALALKIAFKNSGLMDDLMVHEVIDYNKAFENHLKLINLHDAMFCESSPGPVKFAAERLGLCKSEARLPIVEIEETSKSRVITALKECNLV